MAGHRPIADLKKTWSPERRARSEGRKAALAAEYATLEQLRLALGLTQEELAERLDVQQPAVSRLIGRADMKLSTLRDLIEAMGGELTVTAKFHDRVVELAGLGQER